MENERLIYLVRQHHAGLLTAAEKGELSDWLAEASNREAFVDLVTPWMLESADREVYQDDRWQSVLNTVLSYDKAPEQTRGPIPGRVHRIRWRYAAAAILVGLVGMGGYFLVHSLKNRTRITASAVSPADILPGGNRAVLILGGGQQIMLDNAANGVLAREGNAAVEKTNDGRITYTVSKAAPAAIVFNKLITPRGGQYQLVLPDGTRVWLDALSSVTYPTAFTGRQRRISIQGQAYLEVAHDAARPFEVNVNGRIIRDIGTSFNINAYNDEPATRITLASGSIAVLGAKGELRLKQAGQQAVLSGNELKLAEGADLSAVLAWKNGRFSFDQTDLKVIMRQIARWYDVDITYEKNSPAQLYHGGVSRTAKVSEVLNVLEYTGVHFKREGKNITVMP